MSLCGCMQWPSLKALPLWVTVPEVLSASDDQCSLWLPSVISDKQTWHRHIPIDSFCRPMLCLCCRPGQTVNKRASCFRQKLDLNISHCTVLCFRPTSNRKCANLQLLSALQLLTVFCQCSLYMYEIFLVLLFLQFSIFVLTLFLFVRLLSRQLSLLEISQSNHAHSHVRHELVVDFV